jgi:hypothetical protein
MYHHVLTITNSTLYPHSVFMCFVWASEQTDYISLHSIPGGTRWRSWWRHCVGSIPDGVIGIFHWHNPSARNMALGLTLPLTEMSTRNISWRVKAGGAWGWPYHLHVPIVLKSGSLNLLEPSGSVQGCNGIALPLQHTWLVFVTETQCVYCALRAECVCVCVWFGLPIFFRRAVPWIMPVVTCPVTGDCRDRCQVSRWDFWWTMWHLGQVFLRILGFTPVSIIPPILRTHLHLRVALTGTNRWSLGTFRKAALLRTSGAIG